VWITVWIMIAIILPTSINLVIFKELTIIISAKHCKLVDNDNRHNIIKIIRLSPITTVRILLPVLLDYLFIILNQVKSIINITTAIIISTVIHLCHSQVVISYLLELVTSLYLQTMNSLLCLKHSLKRKPYLWTISEIKMGLINRRIILHSLSLCCQGHRIQGNSHLWSQSQNS